MTRVLVVDDEPSILRALRMGYTLVVANAMVGSNNYFFVPVHKVALQPEKWTATAYFGTRHDGGKHFTLATVVIPSKLEGYVLGVWNFQRWSHKHKKGAFLAAPDLPPAPAYIAGHEIVRRSHSGTGCTQ